MCQFSGIFKGILGPKWENPVGAPYDGHFEFLTKSKSIFGILVQRPSNPPKNIKIGQPLLVDDFAWFSLRQALKSRKVLV